jgi:hypothetical protein
LLYDGKDDGTHRQHEDQPQTQPLDDCLCHGSY